MDPEPFDPWRGVTLAEIRASTEFEEAQGRGPNSPGRLAQPEAERRELARLADHWAKNPHLAPPGYFKGKKR